MNKHFTRLIALLLSVLLVAAVMAVPASAATYKKGTNSVSTSYKNGPYYANFSKIPLTGDGRLDVLAVALSQLGYEESSSVNDLSGLNGSDGYNMTEYNYNMGDFGSGYGYYWCATFVSWALFQSNCTDQMGYKDWTRNHTNDGNYIWCGVSCSQWAAQLRRYGHWKNSLNQGGAAYTPQPGDLIFFTWDGKANSEDHIGIVVYSDGTKVYTVEGNTSDASGLDSNGGGVYFKSYNLSATTLAGYGVMPYKTVSSAKKIDYSGANPSTGLYMATQLKNVYANETDSSYTWRMARFTMFEVIDVNSDGSMLKAICKTTSGETVTGWVKNNSDRVLQLTVTEPEVPEDPDKVALKNMIATAKGIKYTEYSDEALEAFYTAYASASNVYNSESSVSADYKAACNALENALNNKTVVLSNGKPYTTSAQDRNDDFVDDGLVLTDGAKGALDGGNTGYAGWTGSVEAVIDLGSTVTSDTYTVYLAAGQWGLHIPKSKFYSVEVFASNSPDSGFVSLGTSNVFSHKSGSNLMDVDWSTYTLTLTAEADVSARYIKFVITNTECTGLIWIDELEVSYGRPTANGIYLSHMNRFVTSGDANVFVPSFGTIKPNTANHCYTTNVVAKWDATKGAYIVTAISEGVGTSTSEIELADDEILIAAHAWESSSYEDSVPGSSANKKKLESVAIGSALYLHGVDFENKTVYPGAYLTNRGTAVVDDKTEMHYPGDPADCTNPQICTACKEVLVEAHGHSYESVVTEPTCTEQGYTTYTCSVCGDSYVDDYVSASHTEGEWTTLEDGSQELRCAVCGELLDTKPAETYEKGDVNGDGKVNMFDYMMIKAHHFETKILVGDEALRADISGDGKINMFDYMLLKSIVFEAE